MAAIPDLVLPVQVQTTSTVNKGFTLKEMLVQAPATGEPAVVLINLQPLAVDGSWDAETAAVQQRIADTLEVPAVLDADGNVTTPAVPATQEAAGFIDVMMKAVVPASHPVVQQLAAAGIDTSNLTVWEFGKAVLGMRLRG